MCSDEFDRTSEILRVQVLESTAERVSGRQTSDDSENLPGCNCRPSGFPDATVQQRKEFCLFLDRLVLQASSDQNAMYRGRDGPFLRSAGSLRNIACPR